jgi:D-glycero-alpha-D-manno-heptose 1-phosphate guanylyltransferase
MVLVLGRPFLEWVVRYLAAQGVRNVVISAGYRADVVARHFAALTIGNLSIQCIAETTALGTAGGFLNAVKATGQQPKAWLVLNGDSLALGPLDRLMGELTGPEYSGAMFAIMMKDAARYGTVIQGNSGELVRFEEKNPGAGMINAGVYLFRSGLVDAFPEARPLSFEKDLFPGLIARNIRLKVCALDAPFLDIGTPESLPCAEEFIRANQRHFFDE